MPSRLRCLRLESSRTTNSGIAYSRPGPKTTVSTRGEKSTPGVNGWSSPVRVSCGTYGVNPLPSAKVPFEST